jgi:chemotaxis protein CheX
MKAEYINPFITSLGTVFRTMLQCDVKRGSLHLKEGSYPNYPISGVIGLSGRAIGTVVLSMAKEVALKAASMMLMTDCQEVNADVLDAVGELTNMVAGRAKSQLEELQLSVSLPNIVTGQDHEVRFPSNVVPICVPFETPWGPLTLEVGLAPVAEPVAP